MKALNIIAHIPARRGSVRLSIKNLMSLAGKPLVAYAIEAAKRSKMLSQFYVNTEDQEIADTARRYGAQVFIRDPKFSDDISTQDHFNFDFINKVDCDILVLINPVCPLIDENDIDGAINYLIYNDFDTVVSVQAIQLLSVCRGQPINFDKSKPLPRTQDVDPVLACNWAVGVWKSAPFKESFEKLGHASFVGKVGYFGIALEKSIKISTIEDFRFAEIILKGRG